MVKSRVIRLLAVAAILVGVIPTLFSVAHADVLPKTIRVGAYDNPPKIFLNAQGKQVGIFPDILRAIAAKEGWTLEFIFGTWTECLERLEAGELDIMVDVAYSEKRGERFDFAKETVFVNWGTIYTREGFSVESFLDLRGKNIAVMKGSIHTTGKEGIKAVLKKFDIPCNYVEVESYKDVLALLDTGDADAGVVNRLFGALHEEKYAVGPTTVIFNPRHLRFAFPKNSPLGKKLRERIDYHMKAMKEQPASAFHRSITAYLSHSSRGLNARTITTPAAPMLFLTSEEKTWIARHPVVRMGVDPAFAPFEFFSPEGRYQGMAADYLELIGKRLNIEFVAEKGLSWSEAVQKAKGRELDILPCVGITEERKEFFAYTNSYLAFPRVLLARTESAVKRLEDLKHKTLAVQADSSHHAFVSEQTDLEPTTYDTFQEALLAVSGGETDAAIGNLAVSTYYLRQLNLTNLKIAGTVSNSTFPLAFAVRKDWPELVGLLNKALESLTPNEKLSIWNKWHAFQDGDSLIAPLFPLLSAKEQGWLEKHKSIRIGVDAHYAPYSFRTKNGDYAGAAVDFVRQIGKMLGLDIEVVPDLTWPQIVEGARDRNLDVIATAVKTEEREEFLAFTEPYLPTPLVIMAREDDERFKVASDLAGKTVALVDGYSSTQKVLREHPEIKALLVSTALEGLQAVSAGEADAYVGVLGVNTHLARQNGIANLKVAVDYDMVANAQHFAVRKDWPELASMLDKALMVFPEEQRIAILKKWVPIQLERERGDVELPFSLTREESSWLSGHRQIRLGVDHKWLPFEAWSPKEGHQGISSDYVRILNDRLDVSMRSESSQSWSETLEKIKARELDVLPAVSITPDRSKYMLFSKPYITFPIVLLSRKDARFIKGLDDLRGRKVGIVKGYALQEIFAKEHPGVIQYPVADIDAGLKALQEGEIEAFSDNLASITHAIERLGIDDLRTSATTPFTLKLRFGVRSDWPELVPIINKALDSIGSQKKSTIHDHWITQRPSEERKLRQIWIRAVLVAASFALLGLVIFWRNRMLQQQVRQREELATQLQIAKDQTDVMNLKLKELDQMKSMFIASMSHELRTPLNSIIGFSGVILQGLSGDLNDKQRDQLGRVSKAANHLLALITDVIDISKIEAGRIDLYPEDFLLDDVIEEACGEITPQLEVKGLAFKLDIERGIKMHTDRRRLLQCTLNYLSNAVKYTEEGRVDIKVREVDDNIEIVVSDTGIGITGEEMPKVFEAFERLSSHLRVKAGGTGLGLYLTRKIATELLRGSVDVESVPEKGSTFYLVVPKELQAQSAVEEETAS